MIFYFSGCGNSRHVAETLAAGLNDTLIFIPEAAREGKYDYTLAEGESLGFVFPVYAWAPPKLVLDFIEKLQIKVHETVVGPLLNSISSPVQYRMRRVIRPYYYFACTCGDECGLTEKIFRKAIEQKGWDLSACFSTKMPETYIGMPGFKLDTDENARKKIEATDATLARNIPRLLNKEYFTEMTIGNFVWLKSYPINKSFNKFATDDSKYLSTEACIHCGKCIEVCPLKNVTLEEGRPKWNGNCTMCMSCYHHCPVNAIQYGKATVGKGQYFFS